MNRALSIRHHRNSGGGSSSGSGGGRRGFSFSSLRGTAQPELSKRLYKLIKSENNLISAHETAGRERVSIATQLSEWGEQTGDDAISDISDKVGVVLSEIGEQEDTYAHALDDSRSILKAIRNIEKSVQPSRDNKAKIADEIAKLKTKEPESAKLVILEQELVRAEAENLVAEAQLSNVTRQKLKETYNAEFAATIERAEKQIILARHGMRLLKLLDDSPVVPGDIRASYTGAAQARQILNDAEDDLRDWRPEFDDVRDHTQQQQNNQAPLGFSSTMGAEQHHGRGYSNRDSGYAQGGGGGYDRRSQNYDDSRTTYEQSGKGSFERGAKDNQPHRDNHHNDHHNDYVRDTPNSRSPAPLVGQGVSNHHVMSGGLQEADPDSTKVSSEAVA